MKAIIEKAIWKVRHRIKNHDVCLGYLRYEAVRKLNAADFAQIHMRNISGENFDTMIDELIGGEK